MKTIAFTVSVLLVLSLTGCGQLTKMLEEQIAENTTKISGQATLHNQTNHSGITVKMGKQVQAQSLGISAQSVTTSFTTVATTGSTGTFSFDVTSTAVTMAGASAQSIHTSSLSFDTGLYTVTFSKDGYETVTVDNVPVVLGQSVYNLDNVELNLSLANIVFDIPQGTDVDLFTMPNNTDQYQILLVSPNETLLSNNIFTISYYNPTTKVGGSVIQDVTWSQIANTIITGHSGMEIHLWTSGYNGAIALQVKVNKI